MSALSKASVVIIDDEPRTVTGSAAVLREKNLDVVVRMPHQVTLDDLQTADVVAIDHFLNWDSSSRHPSDIAFWPQDGLALGAVLASHLRARKYRAALVLRTGALSELAAGLPTGASVPLLSSQYGLDWIITKQDPGEAVKLHQLASATAALTPFEQDTVMWDEGAKWLNLPASSWREAALAEVQVCRPPEHALASYTTGTAWLRWFAHRILPFPTFLASDLRAATVLRLELSQFETLLEDGNSALGERLRSIQYAGPLNALVKRRWWRAGLDALLDEMLARAPEDLSERQALKHVYMTVQGGPIEMLSTGRPVVTVNSEYEDGTIEEVEECVRLAPDLWPVYADEPWAHRDEVVEDQRLARMVSRGDRHLIASGEVVE